MPREIAVELPRVAYYTGDVIEGTVVIETTREVSSRGLYVDFKGTEDTEITRGSGKNSHTYRSFATIVQWRLPLRGEAPLPAGTYRFPVRFRSGGEGPEVYVELDGDRFFARELIGCRITLNRTGNARIRRVYTRLIGGEWAKADSQQQTTETYRTEVNVPMDQIRVGVPFTFEIPIPADVASNYRGTYSYYSYALHVGLDIAWGFDIVAQTPIVIVR